MLFNSYIFILLFLPVCITGYFLVNRFSQRAGIVFLLGMSLWFYGSYSLSCLALICASIGINYLIFRLLGKAKLWNEGNKISKVLLLSGVVFNLGLLIHFKYENFFLDSAGIHRNAEILLPLGISFYTFQQISFLADCYREERARYSLVEYAAFVTFFPKLTAGPIVTRDLLMPQLSDAGRKRINWDNLLKGCVLFTLGLAKKILIADSFSGAVEWGFSNIAVLDTVSAVIVTLSFTAQIYFDFSGYSDMAVGLAWMLNIDLPVNFDSPYRASGISDFWKRWHITLTDFFRKYVYFPLGGSRKGTVRTCLNTMIVFLLSGLWHGAGWTFIIWGCLHGAALVIDRLFQKIKLKLHPALCHILTFGFVNAAWVYFRAGTVADANQMLCRILKMDFGRINENIISAFSQPELKALRSITGHPHILIVIYIAAMLALAIKAPSAKKIAEKTYKYTGMQIITGFLLAYCILSLSGVSTFLYFNF